MQIFKFLVPILVGIALYMVPIPDGVEPKGWYLFCIFVPTILGIVFKPMPMGAVALFGMAAAVLFGVLDLATEALSGFGSKVIWLIIFVFFIARGFIKTRLGTRMAYFFVSLFGKYTLGLGYSLVFTECIIAPVIPSNAARSGGIMFPILKSIAEALGSRPDDGTARKLGAYLTQTVFHCNLVVSAMFLTAMAANPICQAMAAKQGVEITWVNWFTAAAVPGFLALLVIPVVLYIIYPPEVKHLPQAVDMAKQNLSEMGPMTKNEWIMLSVFIGMITLWIGGKDWFGMNATSVALFGLCTLLATRILTWNDILHETEAWHTLIWLAILAMMSGYLEKFGFISWFGTHISSMVTGMPPLYGFIAVILVYFYSHYFFASNTAHVGAMYAVFLSVAIAVGAPPLLAALILGFMSSLFSHMTHYGSGSAPVFFGMGYVPIATWWRLGFIISLVTIAIWLGIGSMWWKALGLW